MKMLRSRSSKIIRDTKRHMDKEQKTSVQQIDIWAEPKFLFFYIFFYIADVFFGAGFGVFIIGDSDQ